MGRAVKSPSGTHVDPATEVASDNAWVWLKNPQPEPQAGGVHRSLGIASDMAFGDVVWSRLGAFWESQLRPLRGFQNIVQSMKLDPQNLAELAEADAKIIRANLSSIATGLAITAGVFLAKTKVSPGALSVVLEAFTEALTALGYGGRVGAAAFYLREWLTLAWDGDIKAGNKMLMNLVLVIATGPGLGNGATQGIGATSGIKMAGIVTAGERSRTALATVQNWLSTTMSPWVPAVRLFASGGLPMLPFYWSVAGQVEGGLPLRPETGYAPPPPSSSAPPATIDRGRAAPTATTWTVSELHPDLIVAAREGGPAAMRWLREHRYGVQLDLAVLHGVRGVTATLVGDQGAQLATITFQGVVVPVDDSERVIGLCVAALLDKLGEVPLPTTAPRPEQTRMGRSSVRGGRFIWPANDDSLHVLRMLANGRDEGMTAVRRLLALQRLGYAVRETLSAIDRKGKQVVETTLFSPSHERIASVLFERGVCPTQEARWAALFYHAGMGFAWTEPVDLDIVGPSSVDLAEGARQQQPAERAGGATASAEHHGARTALLPAPNPQALQPTLWRHLDVDAILVTATQRHGQLASDEIKRLGLVVVDEAPSDLFDNTVAARPHMTFKWGAIMSTLLDEKTQTKLTEAVFIGPIFRSGMGDSWDVPFFARKAVLLEKAYQGHPDLPRYLSKLATTATTTTAEAEAESSPRPLTLYINPDTGREEPFRINSQAPRPTAAPEDNKDYCKWLESHRK